MRIKMLRTPGSKTGLGKYREGETYTVDDGTGKALCDRRLAEQVGGSEPAPKTEMRAVPPVSEVQSDKSDDKPKKGGK